MKTKRYLLKFAFPLILSIILFLLIHCSAAQGDDGNLLWCGQGEGKRIAAVSAYNSVSDGNGGVIVVGYKSSVKRLDSSRIIVVGDDLAAQRLDSNGKMCWNPPHGIKVTEKADVNHSAITTDGAGGVIVVWYTPNDSKAWAQRLDPSGRRLWRPDGDSSDVEIGSSRFCPQTPVIFYDGAGGAFIGICRRMIHINATGIITPPGIEGVEVIPDGNYSKEPKFEIACDDNGNAFASWNYNSGKIFVQKIDSDLRFTWGKSPKSIADPYSFYNLEIISDRFGGAIIGWMEKNSSRNFELRAQRIDRAGNILWQTGGVPVVDPDIIGSEGYPSRWQVRLVADGTGGAIIAWEDARDSLNSNCSDDVRVQRIDANGRTLWTPKGVLIPPYILNGTAPGSQNHINMVSDGAGGAIITFEDWGIAGADISAAHLRADGFKLWSELIRIDWYNGDLLQTEPQIVYDASGPSPTGAIILWKESGYILAQKVEISNDNPPASIHLSLGIEDAMPGVIVNKVAGDSNGFTDENFLEVVATLSSYEQEEASVTLTVPGNLFGAPINTWTRETAGGEKTVVQFEESGIGRFTVVATLYPIEQSTTTIFRGQIVWRFSIPNSIKSQDVTVTVRTYSQGTEVLSNSTVRILPAGSVDALIITNRQALFTHYDELEVTGLLQQLFTEAQGPPHVSNPRSIIYYVDRYDPMVQNWDNTQVNYTSEIMANQVADRIDALIEDWHEDATQFYYIVSLHGQIPISWPRYIMLVGSDDVVPFYRYDDPTNDERSWDWDSNIDPIIEATDEDYLLTDNPFADVRGNDWQNGDVELWIGRLVGASARDMLSLLEYGVQHRNQRGGVVMASVDGWDLGHAFSISFLLDFVPDFADVPALFRNRGFDVHNDDQPNTEVCTIDVLYPYEGGDNGWNNSFRDAANHTDGMDLFFIGSHANPDCAEIPGLDFSPNDTPGRYTRFNFDHPVVIIPGCHGGLPVKNIDPSIPGGVGGNMVYDIIHEGSRAYIGVTGFSYGSPGRLDRCIWGERLIQQFFTYLLQPIRNRSIELGQALTLARNNFVFTLANDNAINQKTVSEFHLYGVPWTVINYPDQITSSTIVHRLAADQAQLIKSYNVQPNQIMPTPEPNVYSRTFNIAIDAYKLEQMEENGTVYDIISIEGGDMAIDSGVPVLPYLQVFKLRLGPNATVKGVNLIKEGEPVGNFNIPIAIVKPWSQGGVSYTTDTNISTLFPPDEAMVTFQNTSDGLLFILFPIQHNPITGDTIFYDNFTVSVTYETPLRFSITSFSTDKNQYAPGETIESTALVENVSDGSLSLQATLSLIDTLGGIKGTQDIAPFTVASGELYNLSVDWTGLLQDGSYIMRMEFSIGGELVSADSTVISVMAAELVDLKVPETLQIDASNHFEIIFSCYDPENMQGTAILAIRDAESGISETIGSEPFSIQNGETKAIPFEWEPEEIPADMYTAIATVSTSSPVRKYGPVTKIFGMPKEVDANTPENDTDLNLPGGEGDNDPDVDDPQTSGSDNITECFISIAAQQ